MHYIPGGSDSYVNLPRLGGVAYAAQESWVQNETIKENILFCSPYDEERYNKGLWEPLPIVVYADPNEKLQSLSSAALSVI
ncbi:hypothetical protein AcW1_009722 [Taiwanofungus camphoratus]|nr:hypothetical protein AcW1_009722 [Antrodia cinnamomea]